MNALIKPFNAPSRSVGSKVIRSCPWTGHERNMRNRERSRAVGGVLTALALMVSIQQAGAATPGIVMDNETGKAIFFDADSNTITASVALGPNLAGSGDCVILGDRGPAFATDFGFRLWGLDLEVSPPQLASVANPIRISNPGEDIAVSPDGRYLVTCDGNGAAPVSVVDLTTRKEVSSFPLGTDCNSVDVCSNGSVLVTSFLSGFVRRLSLDSTGHLTDTGDRLDVGRPMNAYCSPGSSTGLVVAQSPPVVRSFALSGMVSLDTRSLPTLGLTVVFTPDGQRVFVRDAQNIHAYAFNPATGGLGASPLFEFPVGSARGFFGMEQMAIEPAGLRLYVSEPGALKVYDSGTGSLITSMTHPDLRNPSGVCLPTAVDRDDDGLSDPQEAIRGTNPLNPDSDGDGLRDGFEASHGFNPLLPGEASQDPDADGLNNLAEQTALTDPGNPDSDADGLADGPEVFTYMTDPRNPDTDRDGLSDGAEVAPYASDPRNPDTDAAGVSDGNEVHRDGTNPVDPADDRPAGLAMVMDDTSHKAVVFNRDTNSVVASLSVTSGGAVGDCVITEDGSLGFSSKFDFGLAAIDLQATPPALAPPPNPILLSNPGEDIALSPDGRFLVVCDGSGVAPISVVDTATRSEVSVFSSGTDCNSVDICSDGSVLVTSLLDNAVRRLNLSATGTLSDSGVRMPLPQPVNILCAPDSRSGLVVSSNAGQGLTSFTLPGLSVVDIRALPATPFAAAMNPEGNAIYVRHSTSDAGGIQAYHYNLQTARLSADPFLAFPVANTTRFFGIDQLAVDPSGRQLYVPETGIVNIFDAMTGDRLASLMHPDLKEPTGVCLRYRDQDHDGLIDDLEIRLGTDAANPDTDGDGLQDGFEARNGFNPLVPGEGSADPDGDGLDNLAEQSARTDPGNPDTDSDGLNDGQEALIFHTDPRDSDSDDDGLGDWVEINTYGTNPLQPDTDGGGVRDGNEVSRDETDPLNPSDDRPSGLGAASDFSGRKIHVFDPETSQIVATLDAGPSPTSPEACVISGDGRTGYFTDASQAQLLVTDLDTSPPRISPSNNPISLGNPASDLALSPDGRFLLACGPVGYQQPRGLLSVVDTSSRTVISTYPLGFDCSDVDVCSDGSVLVASVQDQSVRRLELSGSGALIYTGERLNVDFPGAVKCAKDGRSGLVVSATSSSGVRSFWISGLVPVDSRALPGDGYEMALSPLGDKVAVLLATDSGYGISVFGYDRATARFAAAPPLQIPLTSYALGIAVDRSGKRLLAPEGQVIRSYDLNTGQLAGSLFHPSLLDSRWLCLRSFDRDFDGLLDDEERALGTDPANPDTDGDGLRDGFEVDHGLDPKTPAEGSADPDGDGLDNLGEQTAHTDPLNPDSDGDGLSDGAEVLLHGTSPRHRDTDQDGLGDGDEVNSYGTNPVIPDSDGGGVQDGNEVNRDGTDPLSPSDDRPSSPGMVLDGDGQRALVFNPESKLFLGSVNLPDFGTPGDCVISPGGQTGFFNELGFKVWAVNLTSAPPALAPFPNPVTFSTEAVDLAISPNGRYVVACGYGFSGNPAVSVIDTVSRTLVSGQTLTGTNCASVDVCADGSVLLVTGENRQLRRLRLDGSGHLTDTGEVRPIPLSANAYCAPGGEFGLLLDASGDAIESFRIPGLAAVDRRTIPGEPGSAAWRPTGTHAAVYVRYNGESSGVIAYDLNLRTGGLGNDPIFGFPTDNTSGFSGIEEIAIDPSGTELYVPGQHHLAAYSATTGQLLRELVHTDLFLDRGVCLPPAGDGDGDGLKDDEERRLGTNPDVADTDGDGLGDRIEIWNELDPINPADAHQDADGDGLDNLTEITIQTDPRNADTDGDGLGDGAEVSTFGSDPRNPDTDGDGRLDGADNCPTLANPGQQDAVHPNGIGDACEDPEHDAVPDLLDNCPDAANSGQSDADADQLGDACDVCPLDTLNDVDHDGACGGVDNCPILSNPLQTDADADGHGDACDICPVIADAAQQERVACLAATQDGGSCLETQIELIGYPVSGVVKVFGTVSGPPEALSFEVLGAPCGDVDTFEFQLNGVPLGTFAADSTRECSCDQTVQTFNIPNLSLVLSAWRQGQPNEFVIRKNGSGTALAWVRVVAVYHGRSYSGCLFDAEGGDCTDPNLCEAGFTFELPEQQTIIPDLIPTFGDPSLVVPFSNSVLPASMDLSGLRDGPLRICVAGSDQGAGTPEDCKDFTKQGESRLAINGASCGQGPTAVIQNAGGDVECQSITGAPLTLDGSHSSDPDSTPGTNDDIVSFEWFENFGLPSQLALGTGEIFQATLALGEHNITLRVTDGLGQTGTAQVQIRVVDTVPPVILVSVTPSSLWPPFHQLVNVVAGVTATDACSVPLVVLLSTSSSEPDDGAGGGDGQTVNDIQGAQPGTADFQFALRAERTSPGPGRTYQAVYQATDSAGNTASAAGQVLVPHDQGGTRDPINLQARQNSQGTVLDWTDSGGSIFYSVLRGDLAQVHITGSSIDLGPVACIRSHTLQPSTEGTEDAASPPVGGAFFYLVEFNLGDGGSYGSDTAIKPRVPGAGACP